MKQSFQAKAKDFFYRWNELFAKTTLLKIPGEGSGVFLKFEGHCPGGSQKSKTAVSMLFKQFAAGRLKSDSILVDASSGNFGVALSWAAKELGLDCSIVYPSCGSHLKMNLITKNGAALCLFDRLADRDERTYEAVMRRLCENPRVLRLDQMSDQANPEAHYRWTGPEIWEATQGRVSHVFVAVGTGGTLTGIGQYFLERKKDVKVVGVDIWGSIYGQTFKQPNRPYLKSVSRFGIEGVGDTVKSAVYCEKYVYDIVVVREDEALSSWELLISKGLQVGMSTGLVFSGFKKFWINNKLDCQPHVVLVSADGLDHYAHNF